MKSFKERMLDKWQHFFNTAHPMAVAFAVASVGVLFIAAASLVVVIIFMGGEKFGGWFVGMFVFLTYMLSLSRAIRFSRERKNQSPVEK